MTTVRIANTMTILMLCGILYISFCFYQSMNLSTEMTIISGYISDTEGRITRNMDSFHNVHVKRGDRVTIRFKVPARDVAGWNHIDRHLIDSKNIDTIVSSMDRSWKANAPFEVSGEFPIPRHVSPGCGAVIFSQSYYSINWNMISWIVPLKGISPRITLCID